MKCRVADPDHNMAKFTARTLEEFEKKLPEALTHLEKNAAILQVDVEGLWATATGFNRKRTDRFLEGEDVRELYALCRETVVLVKQDPDLSTGGT